MEIARKDYIIGILLIITAGLAGGLGYVSLLAFTPQVCPTCPEPQMWGLPDNWSAAPNSTFFFLDNGTDLIKITLGDILEGVSLAIEEQENPSGSYINEYKKTIYPYTIQDPASGLYFTGVDILDILEKYDTNFAYNMSFISTKTPEGFPVVRTLNMSTGDIITKMYEGDEEPIIIALAVNKGWITESPFGNFTIVGKNMEEKLLNLERIEVLDSWKVEIRINGTLEMIIDPSNMTKGASSHHYKYYRNDWWDFDRQYWGRNISEIISHTSAAGKNYTLRAWSVDGWACPRPFGGKVEPEFNNTDVESGIIPPWIGHDLINETNVPLPETNLLMSLVYADQEFGETGQGLTDPVWPYRRMCGYNRGPFYLIVPGRPRDVYISHVNLIDITVYDGPIP